MEDLVKEVRVYESFWLEDVDVDNALAVGEGILVEYVTGDLLEDE